LKLAKAILKMAKAKLKTAKDNEYDTKPDKRGNRRSGA
jgi:hypothetical protein